MAGGMLRRVAQHLVASSHPTAVESSTTFAADPSVSDSGWPLNLRQNDDGSIVAADLDRLKERELAAARDAQYRLAAQLYATWDSLRPKPPLTVAEASPTGVEAQHAFFLENGFCVVPSVLSGDALGRAQHAWMRAQDETQREWDEQRQGGSGRGADNLRFENRDVYRTFFDIPNLLEVDDVFLDMVDSPALVPLLSRVAGNPQGLDPESSIAATRYDGTMRVGGMVGRVVPSVDNENGYTRWHFDHKRPDELSRQQNPSFRNTKLFVYLWDVPFDGGETAVVPGTHLLSGGPESTLERGIFRNDGYTHGDDALPQSAMPNAFRGCLKAGSALIFDSS